jgi:transcriptional regulator with GAF, ATPase, and Fis domain/tetratricopeptide (TPR) repeat protein
MAAALTLGFEAKFPMPSDELAPPALARWEVVERIGEGASSVVWRVRSRQGEPGWFALKVARDAPSARQAAAREAAVLARLGRRWGPALVDVAPGYLVTRWAEGAPLGALPRDGAAAERTRRVAIVAHAVARALEELHEAGAFHGDVKPDNVLYRGGEPAHDAAEDRVATLVDLGLAGDLGTSAHGGTPRYAAPELRDRGEAGPSADLWALGVLLGELLDPAVRESASPAEAIARSRAVRDGAEPARWIDALLAASPGGRPSAAWVARRAAAWLGLGQDEAEIQQARVERVRRTYLSVRATDLVGGSVVDAAIAGPARTWLEGALSWIAKAGDEGRVAATIQPLGALRTTRWLAALVGPSAVHWRLRREATAEGPLATRLLELAKRRDPAQWTLAEVGIETGGDAISTGWQPGEGEGRLVALAQQLARPVPSPVAIDAAESDVLSTRSMAALAVPLARALARAGDVGRAWAILDRAPGAEAEALRADLARRRGQTVVAAEHARRAMESKDVAVRAVAAATLGRLAWDRGDLDEADRCVAGHSGAAVAEVRALVAWRRGATERAVEELEGVLSEPLDLEPRARLEAARGMLEMARGNGASAASAFSSAVEYATQCGAIVEEATYLTSEAAAATDLGDMSRALSTATRAALLWERIGRPAQAARAWLARAGALATIGARHAVDEAVEEVESRADASGDARARAYAWWARIEVRSPGDAVARDLALQADAVLAGDREDRARSAARLLVWAPDAMDEARLVSTDEEIRSMSAPARWEWWGARALAILAGRRSPADGGVLAALLALVEVPAPLWSRGPALDAAARLATERGDGEAARRLEAARQLAARTLRSGTPAEHLVSLAGVSWARASSLQPDDVTFAPAQVEQLESIVRSLSGRDRLRPLLEQVLDTLVLWTGVERGVLLMRAPDDRLVPRAARNLARRDLVGDQLVLSQTIARRAIEEGTAVVATDAFSTLGDVHASVHALKLRSVLAVPLVARGETLGVVYLDDRGRKGAFGPRELAWVRVVASQAAMAIADARDAVLLRRAARRAERARVRIEAMLAERDAELTVTRDELERTRDSRETRYAYDEIAGRSEPMRELLRLVDRVTVSEVPVLVVGESGTGKELVARAVHRNGPRSRRPFVSENCASVPETLLESTLFGHVRGAFTGASSTRAGLFDVADGGTLFLDEIGEMPMSMQAKLLRVLQDGVVRPVGGERERKVDVRVIAATHRDLEAMVAAGTFREDLLYRLNVITLRVPPLRERPTDIPLLVEHLVAKHGGSARVKVTRAAMAKLTSFPWPGNVRQLENEVRRALVLGDGVIDVPELSAEVARGGASAARGGGGDLRSRVDALEAELVADALHKTRGNQTRAAQMLGLSRFGLQKMMKRLKVKAPANG